VSVALDLLDGQHLIKSFRTLRQRRIAAMLPPSTVVISAVVFSAIA
jgi:hypothetical protein